LNAGDAAGARRAALVSDSLPQIGRLESDHFAGYVTVDEERDGQTFFWFFTASV